MRKIKAWQLAFSFTGCFLGAGFVSGQELRQFFGSFGASGLLGTALASLLLCLFSALLMLIARKTGVTDMEKVIYWKDVPALRTLLGILEVSFMFGIYVVMIAGAGSLAEQLTGAVWVKPVFSILFCAALTAVSLKGIGGLVGIFSKVMPILTLMAISISLVAVLCSDGLSFTESVNENPLLVNWPIAAGTYLSYNFLCAIGVIAPLGQMAKSTRSILIGAIIGCGILCAISSAIILAVATSPEAAATELPMIAICAAMHPAVEYLYAILLFCAMFGASMSVFVPIPNFFARFKPVAKHRLLFSCGLSLLAWLGSNLGFSELIGTVYPVYGYIGAAVLVLIVIHFIKLRKSNTVEV